MVRFTTPILALTLGLFASAGAEAANFCVAVNGGFGNGGTSYVNPAWVLPAKNGCTAWAGFTKTGSTVIAIANGTTCLASDGKTLTLSIFNTDPQFFGSGVAVSDQIQLCQMGITNCPVTGQDTGNFGGIAVQQSCTPNLVKLPAMHD